MRCGRFSRGRSRGSAGRHEYRLRIQPVALLRRKRRGRRREWLTVNTVEGDAFGRRKGIRRASGVDFPRGGAERKRTEPSRQDQPPSAFASPKRSQISAQTTPDGRNLPCRPYLRRVANERMCHVTPTATGQEGHLRPPPLLHDGKNAVEQGCRHGVDFGPERNGGFRGTGGCRAETPMGEQPVVEPREERTQSAAASSRKGVVGEQRHEDADQSQQGRQRSVLRTAFYAAKIGKGGHRDKRKGRFGVGPVPNVCEFQPKGRISPFRDTPGDIFVNFAG